MDELIVYRTTDRVPVRFGEVSLLIAPLDAGQYANISGFTKLNAGVQEVDGQRMVNATLRYSIKGIEGVSAKYPDGTEFELKFDEAGNLTEDSLSELWQVLDRNKLSEMAAKLFAGGLKNLQIEGVEVELPKTTLPSKKKKR